jgi:hypothetical protein
MGACPVCGGQVTARPRGRPGVYCSRACQAKAYRARKAGEAGAGEVARARELAVEVGQAARALAGLVSAGQPWPQGLQAAQATAHTALAELTALARRVAAPDYPDTVQIVSTFDKSKSVLTFEELNPDGVVSGREDTPEPAPAAVGREEIATAAPAVTESARERQDREADRERAEFERRLRPAPEFGEGYQMAEWPGTGRYYLVHEGDRVGYATKTTFGSQWEAYSGLDTKVPGSRTYKTRRGALVEVALHHQHTAKRRRKRR